MNNNIIILIALLYTALLQHLLSLDKPEDKVFPAADNLQFVAAAALPSLAVE